MLTKKLNVKISALILSALALSFSSESFAKSHHHRGHEERIIAAQANYQDENPLLPIVDSPIPFSVENFKTNFEVNCDNSVFEVKVPGLYSIDSYLVLDVPNVGDSVGGYITINGRKMLTFFSDEVRTDLEDSIVNLHFNDRLVYLKEGDKVSVILSNFAPETTVLARGFVIVAFNNSY